MNIVNNYLKEMKVKNRIWYKNYMRLKSCIEQNIESDNNTKTWLNKQRILYKHDMLDTSKIELLNDLNINWYPEIETFLNKIELLKGKTQEELNNDINYQQIKSVINNDTKGVYNEVKEKFMLLGGD